MKQLADLIPVQLGQELIDENGERCIVYDYSCAHADPAGNVVDWAVQVRYGPFSRSYGETKRFYRDQLATLEGEPLP